MSESMVPIVSPASASTHLDGLVARYSVLGAQLRRKRRLAWLRRSLLASCALGAVAASISGWDWRDALQPGLDEVRVLHASLKNEVAAFRAGRAELDEQRAWLELQSSELSDRLAEFDRRAASLEAESAGIRAQTARLEAESAGIRAQTAQLEAALARVDEERRTLYAAAPSAASPHAVDSIDEVQRGLEQQREAFAAQQHQVSGELDVLASRRLELGERRRALEEQRRALEALLNDAGRGAPGDAAPMVADSTAGQAPAASRAAHVEPASPTTAIEPTPEADFSIASMVSPYALGDMRGGIMLGDGMNVSIGLTRSASINGVEQVTNSLTFDGLNRSLGTLATHGLEPVVIQNGPGNMIDASFMNAVPGVSGLFIQNSLDDQIIDTSTVFDVSITDVGRALDGVAAGQALRDTLYFQQ